MINVTGNVFSLNKEEKNYSKFFGNSNIGDSRFNLLLNHNRNNKFKVFKIVISNI